MAEPAPKAERGQQQPLRDGLGRMPHGQRRRCPKSPPRPAAYRSASLKPGRTRRDSAWRDCTARSPRSRPAPAASPDALADARMHYQQHAQEPDENGEHAVPADPLIEQRPGQRRDQEQREKEDGDGLIELEVLDATKLNPVVTTIESGAQHLQHRLGRAERGSQRERPQHDGAEHHMPETKRSQVTSATGTLSTTTRYLADKSRPAKHNVARAISPIAFKRWCKSTVV